MRTIGFALIICSWSMTSGVAAAAERGFYVGGDYGLTKTEPDIAPLDSLAAAIYGSYGFSVVASSSTLDTEDSTYSIIGGYRLFRHLAFEGSYMNLGKYKYDERATVEDDQGVVDLSQQLTMTSTGLMVSALGILPLSYRTELFVRGGIVFTSNEIKGSISDDTQRVGTGSDTASDTDWLVGVGVGMTFAEIYTVRLEYQKLLEVGNSAFADEADIDMAKLGVVVTF